MWTADLVPWIILYAVLLGAEAALVNGRRPRRRGQPRSRYQREDDHLLALLCQAFAQTIQEKAPWLIVLWSGWRRWERLDGWRTHYSIEDTVAVTLPPAWAATAAPMLTSNKWCRAMY